jgi:gliding-associated putative ABC transporter substrate-binding component GldG
MSFLKKTANSRIWLLLVLVLLIAINWAASIWHTRLDFTNEKRFTLSASTKKLLKNIDEPVTIDVFLKGNYPSGFKKLSSSTDDLLREFKEIAGNKLQYHFISPEDEVEGASVKYGDTLSSMGLYPINLTSQVKEGQQQQLVYPYALVHYKEAIYPVKIYQGKSPLINPQELNSSEAMLEYKMIDAISKITQKEKPVVAYATGNGEPASDLRIYDLMENVLRPDYHVFSFDLSTQPVIPAEFNTLIVVKPTLAFTDEEKLKLDQYVMNGGKLLMFIDRLNAEMDSLAIKNEVIAYDRELGLNDMFFKYGVRVNADLVMDLQCDYLPFDVNGDGQFDLLPWNYFPVLESRSNHPINKNLGFVSGQFVNSIDTVETEGIKKTFLLTSSANARTIGTPALISGKENVNAPQDDKYNKKYIPVAVLLEGKFTSMYANRLSQSMQDSLEKYNASFLPQSINNNKMIIVADGDIVLNAVIKGNQPLPMGMNRFTYGSQKEFPFANKDFLQNCLDYLINTNDLSEAKAKDYVVRLLDTKKVNSEKTTWQLLNIAVPVLAVVLFALIFQWIRRRKYRISQ